MVTTMETPWTWLPVNEFRRLHPHVGSRNHIYEECRTGSLRQYSIRVGGKILIRSDALDQLAERRSTQSE